MPGSCSSGLRSLPSARGGHQARERIRREQQEQQEADGDRAHHREHARDAAPPAGCASSSVTARGPAGEHQHPQQQRALVRAPRRGEAVVQRQLRVRMLRDVLDREIAGDEAVGEAAERERDEHELRARRRAARAPSARRRAARAPTQRQRCPARARRAARGSARNGRARESFEASFSVGMRIVVALACAPRRARPSASGGM